MAYKLCFLFCLIISLNSFSQFDSKLLVGKWKLISGKNSDTTIIYPDNDQYFIEFFSNGTYKYTHKRNEEWRNGEWIRGTWHYTGKWKVTGSTVLLYERGESPPASNASYADVTETLVSLTASEMYIISQLNRGGEGENGTLYYKKMQ